MRKRFRYFCVLWDLVTAVFAAESGTRVGGVPFSKDTHSCFYSMVSYVFSGRTLRIAADALQVFVGVRGELFSKETHSCLYSMVSCVFSGRPGAYPADRGRGFANFRGVPSTAFVFSVNCVATSSKGGGFLLPCFRFTVKTKTDRVFGLF